jgi:hypothetical protein
MSEKIGKASLRDAAIGTGIAVDKMLALRGHAPSLHIANIWMPSEEEHAERRAIDARLDAIAPAGGRTDLSPITSAASAITFLSRTFISLAVADRRVIPIRD